MPQDSEPLARDINRIAAYLALDDFNGKSPTQPVLDTIHTIVLLGNQVIATLAVACTLARRAPKATLLFSGGNGHATRLLYGNLRASAYSHLVLDGSIRETMPEAEMYAVVAQRAFALPPTRILIENRSANAGENARFSLRALAAASASQAAVLILQDPTMQRRSILTWARAAETAGLHSRPLSHAAFVPRVEPALGGSLRLAADQTQGTWTLPRLIGLLLGEIRRLRDDENGYGPKGRNFIPHVDIPEPVMESFQRVEASPLAQLAAR